MKTKIIAFVAEIQESNCKEKHFRFNETMVQAMLSGLSVVYSEIFAWSLGRHFAIWVSGNNADLLTLTFQHGEAHLKNAHVLEGNEALQFFDDVVMGRRWNDCSMLCKLDSFNHGYELSRSVDGLGPCLLPMLNQGKGKMNTSPIIAAARYSSTYNEHRVDDDARLISKTIQIKSSDLFYRFYFN